MPIFHQLDIEGLSLTETVVNSVHTLNMSCIGKKYGYECSTCLMKSWCDGVPIKEWTNSISYYTSFVDKIYLLGLASALDRQL